MLQARSFVNPLARRYLHTQTLVRLNIIYIFLNQQQLVVVIPQHLFPLNRAKANRLLVLALLSLFVCLQQFYPYDRFVFFILLLQGLVKLFELFAAVPERILDYQVEPLDCFLLYQVLLDALTDQLVGHAVLNSQLRQLVGQVKRVLVHLQVKLVQLFH